MSEIDQQFIEYVVKSLVGKPDAVHIKRTIDEKGVLLELTVDPEDLGRVIGKRGATAQSLRTLLRALGTKNDARYNLKIIDNGDGDGGGRARSTDVDDDTASAPVSGNDKSAGSTDEPEAPEETKTGTSDAEYTAEDSPAAAPEADSDDDDAGEAEEEAAAPEPEEAPTPRSDATSERLAKTRQELADLDDLDV